MSPDPYKYFRLEARELLDQSGQCVLDLEKGAAAAPLVQRLLRLAHTLKGAARVVRQTEIAEHAHAMEDVLSPLRDATGGVGRAPVDALLAHLDEIARLLPGLAPLDKGEVQEQPKPGMEEGARTVRADLAEMDAVLDGVAETHALVSGLRGSAQGLEQAQHLVELLLAQLAPRRHRGETPDRPFAIAEELRRIFGGVGRSLGTTLDQMDRELHQLRDTAERLRLVSVGSLFTALERMARDTAQTLSKQVVFEGKGGDIRLDSHVLGGVQAALLQITRNAVAHGIETPVERRQAGKPEAGRVGVAVSRRGQNIVFECRDDGRGLDFEAVRRVARQRGLLSAAAQHLGAEELVRLLLRGGISTARAVTDVSGRGIGLDIVREAIDRLGGEIAIRTEPGRGTVLELIVPPSLAALEALLVAVDDQRIAIPLDAVRSTLRLGGGEIARLASGASVAYGDRAITFIPLARALGGRGWPAERSWTVIIVEGAAGLAAIGVDRLLGTARVVTRPLPDKLQASPVVAGATLDAEGNPQLVLDPEALVAQALSGDAGEPDAAPARRPVLVIDDSLTTRMLEQSILESAGYEVDVATSAEEGLEAARRKRYALFLVDVEMPGMDGFTFVERIRADPSLHGIPAILVTSRAASEDRQRGREAGAQGYVVKSEFDQAALLALIRPLVG
jgi:two-component system, chemotaxis family, sensor kinase CheA